MSSYHSLVGEAPVSERIAYARRMLPVLRNELASQEAQAEDIRKVISACQGVDPYNNTAKGRAASVQLAEIETRIANLTRRITKLTTEN